MMQRRTHGLATTFAIIVIAACWSRDAGARSPDINLGHFNKLAMNGYDVMTYWRGGEPKEGSLEIYFEYKDATWVFVSDENRDAFAANPEKFAPRYGGYCAYAASFGKVADVDPYAWRIYKDRLYLNYSPRVRRTWANKIDENIAKANAVWPKPLLTEKK